MSGLGHYEVPDRGGVAAAEAPPVSLPGDPAGFVSPLWHFHMTLAGRGSKRATGAAAAVNTTPTATTETLKTFKASNKAVKVEGVDWFIRENGAKHRTECFELVEQRRACVVRRADVLSLAVRCLNRTFDLDLDRLALVLEFGKEPCVTKGTRAVAEMRQQRDFSPLLLRRRGGGPFGGSGGWEVLFDRKVGHRVEVLVRIPANAPVGPWHLSVITWCGGDNKDSGAAVEVFEAKTDLFYVLFNPFSEIDVVYLPHYAGREEYLRNEAGKIFVGSPNLVKARPWIYGQHRDVVLPAVFHFLDAITVQGRGGGFLRPNERGDPVSVVRAISAALVSRCGGAGSGLIQGRMDGNYEDGAAAPSEWTGSVGILEEFMNGGGGFLPVKYGQCWVFAGLVTTFCRAIGIPCRCVTNYLSARDTHRNMAVDRFFGLDGDEVPARTSAAAPFGLASARHRPSLAAGGAPATDPVWSFHVWNEVWMSREDLPDQACDGWQVVDATPQEQEDAAGVGSGIGGGISGRCCRWPPAGIRQGTGPAPVDAVRRGDIGLSFDTSFVFAEVNSDVLLFIEDPASDWGFRPIVQTNVHHVGRLLVTKATGSSGGGLGGAVHCASAGDGGGADLDHRSDDGDYEVVTNNYKAPDGSLAERMAVVRALKQSSGLWASALGLHANAGWRSPSPPGGCDDNAILFRMVESRRCDLGKPFSVSLHLHNRSRKRLTVQTVMTSRSTFYNGAKAALVKRGEGDFAMEPNERETLTMTVTADEYLPKTVEHCHFVNFCLATVKETGQTWMGEDNLVLDTPGLAVRISPPAEAPCKVGGHCKVSVRFQNPLPVELTGCVFNVEGPGLVSVIKHGFRNILPHEKVTFEVGTSPWRCGKSTIVATLCTRELHNVTGTCKVDLSVS